MKKVVKKLHVIFILFFISACTPEVGSKEWCKMMDALNKSDWTFREGKDYLKHCVFKKNNTNN